MSSIIIHNATILTLDEHDNFYYPGTLEVEDDRISKVYRGAPDHGALEKADMVIDGTDRLVMPGLVDLHFHTSVAKGYNDDLPLWTYLDEIWYPSIRALTPSTARTAALYSYITAIKSGTTTVNDMYRFVDSLASAAVDVGIRAVLSNDVALPEYRLDVLEDNLASFKANNDKASGRIKVWLGHEWLCTSDPDLLARVGAAKRSLSTGLHLHLSESLSENADTQARYGKSPVRLAYEAGCLGPDTVAAHCVHLSAEDVALLAQTGTHVSYNPGSNAKLGNGVADIGALIAAGVNVGLGMDACECHNSPDLFESMKIGCFLQRAVHKDAALCPPRQMLRMATENGARALGIEAGRLEVGLKADVNIVDLTKDMMFTPLLTEERERKRMLESHLVFGCNGSAVEHVFIDGKMVMKDRQILNVDEETVRKDMDALFENLAKDLKANTLESRRGDDRKV